VRGTVGEIVAEPGIRLVPRSRGRPTGSTGNLLGMDPATQSFCIILTTAERSRAPWRLVHLSNAVAGAIV
jgi:hypothetical protein